MASTVWHTRIYLATEAFGQQKYEKAFAYFAEAVLVWHDEEREADIMDNDEYNGWCDLVDTLRLVGRWPVVELSGHYVQTVETLAAAVSLFDGAQIDSPEHFVSLQNALNADLYWIIEGLQTAAQFCSRHEIPFDSQEKILSFELLPDNKIRLYGWSDLVEEGSAEAAEEAEMIAYLRQDFDSLFIAPYIDKDMTTYEKACELLTQGDYAAAIAQFKLACREEPNLQKEIFMSMYEAHYALGQLREAADVLMKAYLLGLHKSQIRRQIIDICGQMLAREAVQGNPDEKARWLRLQDDFS